MSTPVPVDMVSAGFTWTSFFTGLSGASLMGIFALLIRQIGPWRKQTTEATDKLIEQLTVRLEKVEKGRESDRRMHFIEIARMQARYAAQRALDRHKFNNSEANLDALLRILELSPEKAPQAARQAREARAEQRGNEQAEAAMIHAAEIAAVERAERELESDDGP